MPYIQQKDREKFDKAIEEFPIPTSPGELNYVITRLVHRMVAALGESYRVYNVMVGVLECVKLELYRRKVAPYEDKKIEENGDV